MRQNDLIGRLYAIQKTRKGRHSRTDPLFSKAENAHQQLLGILPVHVVQASERLVRGRGGLPDRARTVYHHAVFSLSRFPYGGRGERIARARSAGRLLPQKPRAPSFYQRAEKQARPARGAVRERRARFQSPPLARLPVSCGRFQNVSRRQIQRSAQSREQISEKLSRLSILRL